MEILNYGIGRICSIDTNFGDNLIHTSKDFNHNLSNILQLSLKLEKAKEKTLENLHTLNVSIQNKEINNQLTQKKIFPK